MSSFSLRARWVLPIDQPPIDGGYVSVADGRLADVGAGRPSGDLVEDLGDVVLLPGLINSHTHLEFSDLVVPLGKPGMSLPAWIRLVIGERKRADGDARRAIAAGLGESLAAGVTTLGEIATAPAADYLALAPRSATVQFQEAIGFSAQRVESVFADVERRLDAAAPPAGVSPHAPYTVHPRIVEQLVGLAAARRLPVAMHLAESREEIELLAAGTGAFRELLEERSMWDPQAIPVGSRSLDYLRMLAEAPRGLVIHGNYLTAEEIKFVGARRELLSIAYCPRTHAYFGHDAYPLEAMLAAGARVVLGTDSRASNPDLSVLAEIRFAAARFPEIAPEAWLQMATVDAAFAIGLEREAGALAVGRRADLVALPYAGGDPYESVACGDATPVGVWICGARA